MAQQKDPTRAGMSALGHPVRRQIMRLLIEADEPTSPKALSEALGKHLSGVGYHVRLLADCKAINLVKTVPVRGSTQHFYVPVPDFISTPWVAVALGVPVAGAA